MLNSVDLNDIEMNIARYQIREEEDVSAKTQFIKCIATTVLCSGFAGLGYIMWIASTNRHVNL
jgi:hypothetical protein